MDQAETLAPKRNRGREVVLEATLAALGLPFALYLAVNGPSSLQDILQILLLTAASAFAAYAALHGLGAEADPEKQLAQYRTGVWGMLLAGGAWVIMVAAGPALVSPPTQADMRRDFVVKAELRELTGPRVEFKVQVRGQPQPFWYRCEGLVPKPCLAHDRLAAFANKPPGGLISYVADSRGQLISLSSADGEVLSFKQERLLSDLKSGVLLMLFVILLLVSVVRMRGGKPPAAVIPEPQRMG